MCVWVGSVRACVCVHGVCVWVGCVRACVCVCAYFCVACTYVCPRKSGSKQCHYMYLWLDHTGGCGQSQLYSYLESKCCKGNIVTSMEHAIGACTVRHQSPAWGIHLRSKESDYYIRVQAFRTAAGLCFIAAGSLHCTCVCMCCCLSDYCVYQLIHQLLVTRYYREGVSPVGGALLNVSMELLPMDQNVTLIFFADVLIQ